MIFSNLLAALPSPDSAESIGWLILTIAAVSVASERIMRIVDRFKGKNPNAENLTTFATNERVNAEVARLALEDTNMKRRVDYLEQSIMAESRATNRALGRIEGALGTTPQKRD